MTPVEPSAFAAQLIARLEKLKREQDTMSSLEERLQQIQEVRNPEKKESFTSQLGSMALCARLTGSFSTLKREGKGRGIRKCVLVLAATSPVCFLACFIGKNFLNLCFEAHLKFPQIVST